MEVAIALVEVNCLRIFKENGGDKQQRNEDDITGSRTVDVHGSVHRDTIMKVTNKMPLYRLIYFFFISSTCFGRCFRPSPGALDCIYSIW